MAVHLQRLRSSSAFPATIEPDSPLPSGQPPGGHGIRDVAKRGISHAATAALLLLTLAAGCLAALQRPPESPQDPPWTPAMVRAFVSAGNVGDVALAEARFALNQLPAGDKEVVFYRLTIPPGESLTALAGPSCGCPGSLVSGGVGMEVVQSGAYRLRLATEIEVQRHGEGRTASIPAHTDVTLGPGDAAIYPDYTAAAEISVVGDAPVQLIGVAIVGNEKSGVPAPQLPAGVRGEELSRSVAADWKKIAAGPIGVSLRLVTLPAGTHIAPYEPIGLEAMRVENGTIARSFFKRGADSPTGRPLRWSAGRVTPLMGIEPGVRYDLASDDDGPAELLVLIIEPVGVSAQTLAP